MITGGAVNTLNRLFGLNPRAAIRAAIQRYVVDNMGLFFSSHTRGVTRVTPI